jgi:hypothetical protein
LITAVLIAAGAISAAALAAPTAPAGGHVYIHATGGPGATGTMIVVGAIGDHGTTLTVDRNGKPTSNGSYVKITLQKGTFEVNSTALNAKLSKQRPMVNRSTCSFMVTGSAPVTLFNGTGLYKGIKGKTMITIAFGGIGPLYTSGPHKGQCNTSTNAKAVAQFATITGAGTVSFS